MWGTHVIGMKGSGNWVTWCYLLRQQTQLVRVWMQGTHVIGMKVTWSVTIASAVIGSFADTGAHLLNKLRWFSSKQANKYPHLLGSLVRL